MNVVLLVGHLGSDPEVKTLDSGVEVASFSLATNEGYKDKDGNWVDRTEWHRCVAWRGQAKYAGFLKKGYLINIEGKLQTRKYTTNEGEERTVTEVIVTNIQNLTKKESSAPAGPTPTATKVDSVGEAATDDGVNDLPF